MPRTQHSLGHKRLDFGFRRQGSLEVGVEGLGFGVAA